MLLPLRQSLAPVWLPPFRTGQSYSATILADGPVGYWRLGESAGTTLVDATGSYNGAYTGGFTLGQTGLISDPDTCVLFDGSTGYGSQSTVNSAIAGTQHATIEAWVNRASSSDTCEIGFNENTGSRFEFSWYSDGNIYFVAENTSGVGGYALGGTGTHHIVLTFDGTQASASNRIIAYVDGSAVTLNLFGTTPPTTLANSSDLGTFYIGHDAGSSLFFNGKVDEVALYNTTLSATQVLNHYNKGI